MLLAFNIGNTNITFGGYARDGRLAFSSRLYADSSLSSDELCYKIINMLELYGVSPLDIEAVILASVVPVLTGRLREALQKMTQASIMEVGPGLKSGVRIRMDNPAQLGAELLCATVGALRLHAPPLLVMNLDTAMTLLAVDAEGSLVGGVILPGPQLSLEALVKNTARLPQVELEAAPRRLLGANTVDWPAQRHGVRHRRHPGRHGRQDPRRAARPRRPGGGHRHPAGQHPGRLRHPGGVPETLILDGLFAIWQRNARK